MKDVLSGFGFEVPGGTVSTLGSGNINDTYLVQMPGRAFVLQRINKEVFKKPQIVIDNFATIVRYLRDTEKSGCSELCYAEPVLTQSGRVYLEDQAGNYWRAQSYVESHSIEAKIGQNSARSIGSVLAAFHHRLRKIPPKILKDPLPGFHDLHGYLNEFDEEIGKSSLPQTASIVCCVDHVARFRELATFFIDLEHKGVLSRRPVHGDPKIDNFIYNNQGRAIGLFDLDTVHMGFVHHDLGDCLRSCCNVAGELTSCGSSPNLSLEIFQWILEGYFKTPNVSMKSQHAQYIYQGILMITFELGLRFFIDHLRGNIYFKVNENGENLEKALIQFTLAEDIRAKELEIKGIISKVATGELYGG